MRAYLVRHGQHSKNVLSPQGVARMQAAAEAIAYDAADHEVVIMQITTYSSQEPRAVMSAGVLAAMFNIRVTGLPLVAFNPANGLEKAITEKRLPDPGQGFVKHWLQHGCDGVEDFDAVQRRAQLGMESVTRSGPVVIATHGGVIEPLTEGMDGADLHDMVEGEIAVVEGDQAAGFTVRFLNGTKPE